MYIKLIIGKKQEHRALISVQYLIFKKVTSLVTHRLGPDEQI